jgi:hypothetical protein
MSFDPAEFRPKFVTDDPMKITRGKDMSVVGPGPGEQRSVIEGEMGYMKNRLLRPEATKEQNFRRDASQYLEKSYRGKDVGWRQTLIDQAIKIPNYHNLYIGIFVAALYFRQLSGIVDYRDLNLEAIDKFSPLALEPLLATNSDAKKLKLKKMSVADYLVQLKADLLRHLRLILNK